jgi:iron complex transport system permease protein
MEPVEISQKKQNIQRILSAIFVLMPLVFVVITMFIGRYPVSAPMVIDTVWSKITGIPVDVPAITQTVVWDIRLPRAILGALVGGALAVSGASLQGLFHNPLVDSGILGVSSGAGFGAALGIILFDNVVMIYVLSFIFSLIAVFFSYLIGRIYSTVPNIMLVLGGVIVSSIFSALISFLKYVADPFDELPTIVFWLMGSLANADYREISISLIPILLGTLGLFALRWRINVLSLGDKEARSLGLNTRVYKIAVVVFTTLATAGAVSVSGIIGWIGLVIPHIGRMIVGNDNRYLIPASMSIGACFLILIDNAGRMLTGSELPLSILTALVGGPFYVYLLKRTKGGGW